MENGKKVKSQSSGLAVINEIVKFNKRLSKKELIELMPKDVLRADIARQISVSRAYVTKILGKK